MKKKVLTMLLAVTMSATVGSPVCAADFTSGAESAAEFSESLVSSEGTSENTTDMGTVSEEADVEEKTQRTEEAEEPAAEQEETNDAAVSGELEASEETDAEAFAAEEVAEEDITDEEDAAPEFNDGQEDVLTDSAELPSASKKYPSMKKQSGYVYTVTAKNMTDNDYVKFVPGKTANYVLKKTSTLSGGYENINGVYYVYDSKFKQMISDSTVRGYSCYKLEKGKTYYLRGENERASKTVFHAEILADVVSIKAVKIDKSIVFYTPIDFYQDMYETNDKTKYDVAERWRGKIKVTYSDGKTETMSSEDRNKYGEYLNRYVIYKGKKSSPVAGTYDIHLKFDSSKAEAVVKNVKVKKLSSMPTINGSGTKTLPVNSNGFYVRFKTGKSTNYRVSVTFPYYRLGDQPISIEQEKNGTLEYSTSVRTGKTCTLKANTVYYFHVNLHSGWSGNPTGTIKVTPVN